MAATAKISSKSPTIRRIMREAQELASSPSADYTASPLDSDLFEWHFTLRGPPNSAFSEGLYHGRIVLPPTYPLRPPSFRFLTPSGRFEANREICLSISGHHEETWQPAWGVRTALVALRSFMETDPQGQLGGMDVPDNLRRQMAAESPAFRCPTCGRTNADIMRECEEEARRAAEGESGSGSKREEVVVPDELKLAFRDELGGQKQVGAEQSTPATAAATTITATEEDTEEAEEEAELAEGFVQTVPMAVQPPPPRPPLPTRTIPIGNLAGDGRGPGAVGVQMAQAQVQRVSNDGVPAWIDRLIMVLSVALVAVILKVFLA